MLNSVLILSRSWDFLQKKGVLELRLEVWIWSGRQQEGNVFQAGGTPHWVERP